MICWERGRSVRKGFRTKLKEVSYVTVGCKIIIETNQRIDREG